MEFLLLRIHNKKDDLTSFSYLNLMQLHSQKFGPHIDSGLCKGNRTIEDLRYREKKRFIRLTTLIFAPIKS